MFLAILGIGDSFLGTRGLVGELYGFESPKYLTEFPSLDRCIPIPLGVSLMVEEPYFAQSNAPALEADSRNFDDDVEMALTGCCCHSSSTSMLPVSEASSLSQGPSSPSGSSSSISSSSGREGSGDEDGGGGFELKRILPREDGGFELPNNEDGGGRPAGVKEGVKDGVGRAGVEEGGGPAGVVDKFEAKLLAFCPRPLERCERESGVDGGLEEKGTVKAMFADEPQNF